MAKPALGRGLGALLGGSPVTKPPVPAAVPTAFPQPAPPAGDPRDYVQRVALDRIVPCPFQPRKDFSPLSLQELADSIKEQGIVQPLIVREQNGRLELIAGERRWRLLPVCVLEVGTLRSLRTILEQVSHYRRRGATIGDAYG